MSTTILDELLVALGFEYDPKEVKKFKDDVDRTITVVGRLAKYAAAGAAAITGLVVTSTKASDEQGKLAQEIGDTVENIDALDFAATKAGVANGALANSLRQLAIRSSEAARGTGSGVEAFGILGLSATNAEGKLKPVSELFLEISSAISSLNRVQQIELADKLGVKDSIRLLQQGPEAISALVLEAQALGVTTEKDAVIAAEFQDSLTSLWRIIKQVSRVITQSLAPVMSDLAETFAEWWKTNKDLIEQNIPKWIESITTAVKYLTLAFGFFLGLRIAMHLIALIGLLKGVTLATLAVNAAMFLLPILITAIITAIALLAEDAYAFFNGQESFIGDMLKKYPQWEKNILAIAAVFATIADLTLMIFNGWAGIIGLFKNISFNKLGETFNDKNILSFLGDITGLYGVGGQSGLIPETVQSMSKSASTAIDKMEIIVNGGRDSAEQIANSVFNIFQQSAQDLNSAVDQ